MFLFIMWPEPPYNRSLGGFVRFPQNDFLKSNSMYACMVTHITRVWIKQSGKVANPARGQLNREN